MLARRRDAALGIEHPPRQRHQRPARMHHLHDQRHRGASRRRAQVRAAQRARDAARLPEARLRDGGDAEGGEVVEDGGDGAAVDVAGGVAHPGLDGEGPGDAGGAAAGHLGGEGRGGSHDAVVPLL